MTPDELAAIKARCTRQLKWNPLHVPSLDITALLAEVERLKTALQFVGEVSPGRDNHDGAIVSMTWEEWNRLREATGRKPVEPSGSQCMIVYLDALKADRKQARAAGFAKAVEMAAARACTYCECDAPMTEDGESHLLRDGWEIAPCHAVEIRALRDPDAGDA